MSFRFSLLVSVVAFVATAHADLAVGPARDPQDIFKTLSPIEKCILLARPSDIVVTDAPPSQTKNLKMTREFWPGVIVDGLAGRNPINEKYHSGVLVEVGPLRHYFRDTYSAHFDKAGGGLHYNQFFVDSEEGLTIYRAKDDNPDRDEKILKRAREFDKGKRTAAYCSVSVSDMYQGFFESEVGLGDLTSLTFLPGAILNRVGRHFETPSGLSQSKLLRPVCKIKKGKLVYPETFNVEAVRANMRFLEKSKSPELIAEFEEMKLYFEYFNSTPIDTASPTSPEGPGRSGGSSFKPTTR
jgi:hypothetical protein